MRKTKILVTGLPGSGKTFYSKIFSKIIPDSVHFNADDVRKQYSDWDFSLEGRIRQLHRMNDLFDKASEMNVILDFICPLKSFRDILQPNIIIYIKGKGNCLHPDTTNIYEPPSQLECETLITINSINL